MSAPIYYTGQRVISAEANNNVESFVLGVYDGILEDINGGLEVNIGFKFKLPGVFATAEVDIKIVKSVGRDSSRHKTCQSAMAG
jgi:hypothetical protein